MFRAGGRRLPASSVVRRRARERIWLGGPLRPQWGLPGRCHGREGAGAYRHPSVGHGQETRLLRRPGGLRSVALGRSRK